MSTPDDISTLGEKLRPNQTITMGALKKKLPDWSMTKLYATLREMQSRGMVTRKMKIPADKSMVTFHNPPLAKEARQPVVRRNKGSAKRNGLFTVERTFCIKSGVYTARELKVLAEAVLKELNKGG
jgi:hypothetical protein